MTIRRFQTRNGEGAILLPGATIREGVITMNDENGQHAVFIAAIEAGEVLGISEILPEPAAAAEDVAEPKSAKKSKVAPLG